MIYYAYVAGCVFGVLWIREIVLNASDASDVIDRVLDDTLSAFGCAILAVVWPIFFVVVVVGWYVRKLRACDLSAPSDRVTLTEEHSCSDCEHQIYDHRASGCIVRRSDGQMCTCKCFVFRNEGALQ